MLLPRFTLSGTLLSEAVIARTAPARGGCLDEQSLFGCRDGDSDGIVDKPDPTPATEREPEPKPGIATQPGMEEWRIGGMVRGEVERQVATNAPCAWWFRGKEEGDFGVRHRRGEVVFSSCD